MDLVPFIYWEKQEAGSQLCAQHCLNNLLQVHSYTEFDLAEIARKLDEAENATLSSKNQNKKSYNFDDTGFFSISVLERAMEVWDLTLVRWRGEAMKQYQDRPEEQAGFILHLSSHWIPLRRFAPRTQNGASTKRWYNLNSFNANGPEWISPVYLQMVLSQAEEEGYSVFAIRKATPAGAEGQDPKEAEAWNDGGTGILPECDADRMALELGEPVNRSNTANIVGPGASGSQAHLASINPDQPSVDTSITPPAGPSSPPTRRRRRQEDLFDPDAELDDEYAQFQPPRAGRSQDVDVYEEPGFAGPSDFTQHSRDYDDEDAALQAALKASMEDVPADWVPPTIEPKLDARKQSAHAPTPVKSPAPAAPPAARPATPTHASGPAAGSKFKEELDDDDDTPAEKVSADEIRRRRLARFGAPKEE